MLLSKRSELCDKYNTINLYVRKQAVGLRGFFSISSEQRNVYMGLFTAM